jgi:rhodanese-related sulfurtransferase
MRARVYWPWFLSALSVLVFAACAIVSTPAEVPPESPLDRAVRTFLADMGSDYGALTIDALSERLAQEPRPFVLDVRSIDEVQEGGYIEGAVVIPLRELAKKMELLPWFDTPVVTYSGSSWRSTIAMTALELLGWKTVYSLIDGGFAGWVERGNAVASGLPPEPQASRAAEPDPELLALMDGVLTNIPEGWGVITPSELSQALADTPNLLLIDVRAETEIKEKGFIEGQNRLVIPIEDMLARRTDWPADKDTPIVTYCGSGYRCTITMTILWSYGYINVRNLEGGLRAWAEAGYPVAPGS